MPLSKESIAGHGVSAEVDWKDPKSIIIVVCVCVCVCVCVYIVCMCVHVCVHMSVCA